jgi:UDP-N-acetylglucosamine acyltransferase
VRRELSKVFKLTYRANLHLEDAIQRIEQEVEPIKEVRHWLEFCRASKRGLLGLQGVTKEKDEEMEDFDEEEEFVDSFKTQISR